MRTKLFKTVLFIFSFIFILQNQIAASIASGTLVKTSQGLVPVENLKIGDKVVAPNFDQIIKNDALSIENSLLEVAITSIAITTTDKIVLIKTDNGDIQTNEEQLFWELESNSFVKAKDIKPENLFINISEGSFGFCECIEVVTLDVLTSLYDLTLDQPHVFFVSNDQILIHNFLPALGIVVGVDIVFGATLESVALTYVGACLSFFGINILTSGIEASKYRTSPNSDSKNRKRWWKFWRKNKGPRKGPGIPPILPITPDNVDKFKRNIQAFGDRAVRFFDKNLKHIFRNKAGLIGLDTPQNRELLLSTANNKINFLGKDMRGNEWFAKITENDQQIWTAVRDNLIRDAGINDVARSWDPQTGLCRNLMKIAKKG